MTTEEFVNRLKVLYPDRNWGYSETVFDGFNKPVKITCLNKDKDGNIHGSFWMTPNNLLYPRTRICGCKKCEQEERAQVVIRQIQEKFPHFDLSKFTYNGMHTKSTFVCRKIGRDGKEHGEFETIPATLLDGNTVYGCKKCEADARALSTNTFIVKLQAMYPDRKWDLSETVFESMTKPVKIICLNKDANGNIHGPFWLPPKTLLGGNACGCQICKHEAKEKKVIAEIRARFPDLDLSKFVFKSIREKSTFICHRIGSDGNEHGEFNVLLSNLLRESTIYGCRKCANEYKAEQKRKTKEQFISEFRSKWPRRNLSFEKFEYFNTSTKSTVTCHEKHSNGKEHGDFLSSAVCLLNGHGCPICNQSHMEEKVAIMLSDFDIGYVHGCGQKVLPWLGRQHLDFYLSDYNAAIECQGGQHFFPVEHFGGEEEFLKRIERDQRKKQLCEENSVRLFYICYDEDVGRRLKEILSEIGAITSDHQ